MKLQRFLLLCSVTAFVGMATQTYAKPVASQKTTTSQQEIPGQNTPKAPVAELYQALSKIQQLKNATFAQKATILKTALEKSYDFQTILTNTVGYRYNSFSPTEKTQLLTAFTDYTVARYLSSLADENDNLFQIQPELKAATVGNDQIVSTKVGDSQDMGSATQINYLVRQTPQGWRIVDVLLNGHISQVAVQHGDFSNSLAKGGTTNLIHMLNEKTKSFSKK